jgi:hypothetical protein
MNLEENARFFYKPVSLFFSQSNLFIYFFPAYIKQPIFRPAGLHNNGPDEAGWNHNKWSLPAGPFPFFFPRVELGPGRHLSDAILGK